MLHRISCWIYSNWRKCTYRYCRRTCGISEIYYTFSGIILGAGPANERRRYIVTSSLIDWAHTQNDPCLMDQKFWCWDRPIPNKPWCCWCPGSLFRQVIRWHDIGITPGTVWHMARRSSVENWCEVQAFFHFFQKQSRTTKYIMCWFLLSCGSGQTSQGSVPQAAPILQQQDAFVTRATWGCTQRPASKRSKHWPLRMSET